jgi:hypothetical protein
MNDKNKPVKPEQQKPTEKPPHLTPLKDIRESQDPKKRLQS